jgi:hypothetical protein
MMGLVFALALVVTLSVLAWRKWQQRAVERSRPGARPETALAVHDFGDIDMACRAQVCECGGLFAERGEGPVEFAGRPLRTVTLECGRCERQRRLYFDLSELRH